MEFVRRCRDLAGVVALACFSASALAYLPEEQYQDLIKVDEGLTRIDGPFGEVHSLYTGELSFRQTDLDWGGTGLPIVIQRVKGDFGNRNPTSFNNRAFGDWGLNTPRIMALTPVYSASQSPRVPAAWVGSDSSYERCKYFGLPGGSQLFSPGEWFEGYTLATPEAGNQALLGRDAAVQKPVAITAGAVLVTNFPATTTSNWVAGCGIPTDNETNPAGEGFIVVSPSGVKYWMSWMVYYASSKYAASWEDAEPGAPPSQNILKRNMAHLMVTRMEDRFGNWLSYNYSGNQLTGITSSDGRVLTIAWRTDLAYPVIDHITQQPAQGLSARTWTYSYAAGANNTVRLTGITLPDQVSHWSFSLAALDEAYPTYGTRMTCNDTGMTLSTLYAQNYTGTMTHPSGMVGSFTLRPTRHGRSNVPYFCQAIDFHYEVEYPNLYDNASLVNKSHGGYSWNYWYGTPDASWSKDCPASGCFGTAVTTVGNPGGSITQHTFSNRFDVTEGQEKRSSTLTATRLE